MALSSSFRRLSQPDYLKDAEDRLSAHESKLCLFQEDVDRLRQNLSSRDTPSHIRRIAENLRFEPRLLYGLNSILRGTDYRLECLTSRSQVNHYVLVDGHNVEICSFIPHPSLPPSGVLPSSGVDVRNLIESTDRWNLMLEGELDVEWLACLAQVIQEILDDPTTSSSFLPTARKRLLRLSKRGIIPPSIFIHFAASVRPRDFAADYKSSGGGCDVHKFDNGDNPICFRVIRHPQGSQPEKIRADFYKEVVIWRQLEHPNIVKLIGATVEIYPGRHCFVLPWFPHGDIMNYLKTHPNHDKSVFVDQIIDGVYYLHNFDPPVSHKDIKGANVLVKNDSVCVLSDFGLSSILDSQRSKDSGGGTLYWMAPEMFKEGILNPDARPRDIYSLGCTIYEIYTGKPPSAIMHDLIRAKKPKLPPKCQSWTNEETKLWACVGRCLDENPEARPDIKLFRDALRGHVSGWPTGSSNLEKFATSLTTLWEYAVGSLPRKAKRLSEIGNKAGPSY